MIGIALVSAAGLFIAIAFVAWGLMIKNDLQQESQEQQEDQETSVVEIEVENPYAKNLTTQTMLDDMLDELKSIEVEEE